MAVPGSTRHGHAHTRARVCVPSAVSHVPCGCRRVPEDAVGDERVERGEPGLGVVRHGLQAAQSGLPGGAGDLSLREA